MTMQPARRIPVVVLAAIFLSTLFASLGVTERAAIAQEKLKPIILRFVSDFPPPPHPAPAARIGYQHRRRTQLIRKSYGSRFPAPGSRIIPECLHRQSVLSALA